MADHHEHEGAASHAVKTGQGGHEEIQQMRSISPGQTHSQGLDIQPDYSALVERVDELTKERNYFRASFQATATKLHRITSQNRGFPQLDDSYLVDQVGALRTQIWSVSTLYFGDEGARTKHELEPDFTRRMKHRVLGDLQLESLVESAEHRPMLAESFIWSVIVSRVFGEFWWAGDDGSDFRFPHNAIKKQFSSTVEDLRTFQRWSATTTSIIQQSRTKAETAGKRWENNGTEIAKSTLVADIRAWLIPCLTSSRRGLKDALHDILDKAINIDELISSQLARFEWVFHQPGTPEFISSEVQFKDGGEIMTGQAAAEATIALCPGLAKRGRSTGEEFDKEVVLLPMMASRAAPPPIPAEQGELKGLYPSLTDGTEGAD